MRRILTVIATVAVFAAASAWACSYSSSEVRRALSDNPKIRAEAIAELRDAGAMGLWDVIAMRDMRTEQLASAAPENVPHIQAEIVKLNELIDVVGGAKYCSVSQLYWYTDLEKAKAEAARMDRPILSLRMLGNLNEEFSCANSRFFRTTLYANEEISKTLREKFVLHWQSVRPVPRVTIDFGDGRKLERTLTGNSIHYVLDKSGRPLDGLPGLYGPKAFQEWLARAEKLTKDYEAQTDGERAAFLQQHHYERMYAVNDAFATDLQKVTQADVATNLEPQQANQEVPAKVAGRKARTKELLEIPVLRAMVREQRKLPLEVEQLDESIWLKIAALHSDDAQLDNASVELIKTEHPTAVIAGRRAAGKARIEDPLARLVRSFQASIALDTVRNEYTLHRQLHGWYLTGDVPADVVALNERVYAELFLTPSSDPWLGLISPDTYSALQNNGVKVETVTTASNNLPTQGE
jgi:hypothetical protein